MRRGCSSRWREAGCSACDGDGRVLQAVHGRGAAAEKLDCSHKLLVYLGPVGGVELVGMVSEHSAARAVGSMHVTFTGQ